MNRIIYFYPQELVKDSVKGSELRPIKMKEAFERLGYKVDLVIGNSLKRKKSIGRIKSLISSGQKYDFVYAESTNMPIPLSDENHLPNRLFIDYKFFKFLKKKSIPIGLFYRDIYWNYKGHEYTGSKLNYILKRFFHWIEWKGILKTVDHLFLPTVGISELFPSKCHPSFYSALPPGHDIRFSRNINLENSNDSIKALYVGGIKPPHYDLRPFVKILGQFKDMHLTLCCRHEEWMKYQEIYQELDMKRIHVVHANSNEVDKLYKTSDLIIDIREPKGYLKYAMPIKIFEAVGNETPILLLKGSEYANFVQKENLGWAVDTYEEMILLLKEIKLNKQLLAEKIINIKHVKLHHTWNERAALAASILEKIHKKKVV